MKWKSQYVSSSRYDHATPCSAAPEHSKPCNCIPRTNGDRTGRTDWKNSCLTFSANSLSNIDSLAMYWLQFWKENRRSALVRNWNLERAHLHRTSCSSPVTSITAGHRGHEWLVRSACSTAAKSASVNCGEADQTRPQGTKASLARKPRSPRPR